MQIKYLFRTDGEDGEYGDEADDFYFEKEPVVAEDTGYSPQPEISSTTNYDATETEPSVYDSNTFDQGVKYEGNEIEENGEEILNNEYNLKEPYPEQPNIEYEAAAVNDDTDAPIEIDSDNTANLYSEINTDVDQGAHKSYAETNYETYGQPDESYSETGKDDNYAESSTDEPNAEITDNTYPEPEPIEIPYTEPTDNLYPEANVDTPNLVTNDETYPETSPSVPYSEYKDKNFDKNIPYEDSKLLTPYELNQPPAQETYENTKLDGPYKNSPEYHQPSTEVPVEYERAGDELESDLNRIAAQTASLRASSDEKYSATEKPEYFDNNVY